MTQQRQAPAAKWDAGFYDRSFGFVSNYGADLVDLLAPQPDEQILDLGCGTGTLTAEIAAKGAQVIGSDGDADMVARASASYPDIIFVQADGQDFELDEPVDAIFSNAALHWMKQPDRVVACAARALKPGGRFVVEMGGYRNVRAATDALYQALEEEGVQRQSVDFPWYFPRSSTQVRRLEDAGFDVEFLRYFRRPTPLEHCENGLADWFKMFARNFLDAAPDGAEERVVARAAAIAEEALCQDGVWRVDYTRLRFVARRLEE